uniref:MFS domain-containing protein n=1 Tax=Haemonchus placei TaxID=6290 RepID=A0A0N4X919_HAEPC
LCVICGWTFRPLHFREVSEEEEEEAEDSIEMKKPKEATIEENAALLTTGNSLTVPKLPREAKSLEDISCSEEEREEEEDFGTYSGPVRQKVSTVTSVLEYMVLARDSFLMSSPPSAWRKRSDTVGERHAGYINRKDVFYTGSITNVAEFKEHPHKYRSTGSLQRRPLSGTLSVSVEKLREVRETSEEVSEDTTTDNVEGSHMFKTISRMLSLSLLIDPTFLIFAISNLLTSVGFNSPLYFLPLHAMKGVGLDSASSSRVLSVFGLCNTLGRVVFGVVADHRLPLPYGLGEDTARNRLWMYNISFFVSLSVYAGLFGFSISSYICLTSVILVDLLGLDKLTNAFGLLLLWQGVGTVFGPPISGYLADITHSYVWSFVFCGANLLVSSFEFF